MEGYKYATVEPGMKPIIYITFTGHKSTDENFDLYLQETANLYEAKERLAIIFDASKATIPSFAHQKKQAEWLKAYKKQMVDYCVGTAYVIPNATIRAVLKMIFSLQKQPIPYEIFPKLTDAEAWVKEKLAEKVIS